MYLQLWKKFFSRGKIFLLRLSFFEIYLAINSYDQKKLICAFPQTDSIILSSNVGEKKCPKIIPDKSITFGDTVRAALDMDGDCGKARDGATSSAPRWIDSFSLSPMLVMTACESTSASLALVLTLFTRAATNTCIHQTRCHSHHKGLRAPINPNYSYECCRPAAVTRRKVRPVHKLCRAGRTEFSMQFE